MLSPTSNYSSVSNPSNYAIHFYLADKNWNSDWNKSAHLGWLEDEGKSEEVEIDWLVIGLILAVFVLFFIIAAVVRFVVRMRHVSVHKSISLNVKYDMKKETLVEIGA